MESQKTTALRKIPSWLRSFRISKDASVPEEKEGGPASCQTKQFLRSYRRSLSSKKSGEQGEKSNCESQDVARASLMSIRKIWAEEAKAQAFSKRSTSEQKSKKPCALRSKLLGSPSKIPISEKMQAHHRGLQSSLNHSCCSPNKENFAPPSAAKCKHYGNQSSAGSSDGNLASEIVLSAARHAKNRRSMAKEQGVWRKAVNNIGLPRTSTELGQLPKVCNEQDLLITSPVMGPPWNEKHERVGDWVLCNRDWSSGISAQHALPYAQHKRQPSHLAMEETVPKSVDCAPKVPPRTYLAKLVHAKAHLAKTTAPSANSKIPAATENLHGAKSAISKYGHSLSNQASQDFSLLSRVAQKQQVPPERRRRLCVEVGTPSQELASRLQQQPKRAVRPQVQHNPVYSIKCTSRAQKLNKNCSTGATDVMADDEATVLNCSCERCLMKFNAAGKHAPGRMGDSHTNYSRVVGHQAFKNCLSKNGKKPAALSHHCECCQFKKTYEELKVADDKVQYAMHTKPSCVKNSDQAAKCSAGNKHAFQCQDEITKVIEEAVKASIEKLLSVNSNPQSSKARSVESLHEQAECKKAAASPLKYILLSSCRSGTTGSLLDSTEEVKVDSGIASYHQSCLTVGTVKKMTNNNIDTVNSCSQVGLERTASLPSLVESSSPAKLRVSTAFIKLVKRVSLGQGNEGTSSHHSSFLDVTMNQGSMASQESCSQYSSSGTEGCWQTAESHHAEDSHSQSEIACDLIVQDEANVSSSCTAENGQLKQNEAYKFQIQQSTTPARLQLDSSSLSIGSVSSRKPPDGWERTPPYNAPDVVDINDELSELNPCISDAQGECFSSDSDGSDDQHILEEVIRKGMGMTPPIKLPTRCPKLVKTPRKFKSAEMFCGKAKLKLAAYVNSGHITVHVIRAAKLLTSRGGSANAYIKVSLQPDHLKRAYWRTAVVKSSRNPEFDHKFSFELMAEDAGKRLLVTVWHRDFENKRSELLGSMSFGMEKVLNSDQHVKGWYRLLRQDLGMRRHFAARCSRGTCARVKAISLD
ncbi:uncharacterized protein LOC142557323 isoform X2 [Dermacentor variabilis]|uniref:uncharacterized protein LOC142557323 isoform X2 n=1 Tax=Dermacentor variabilis TaxID=34621 RepID=UPI003F5B330C